VRSVKLVVPLAFLLFGGVLMVWLMSGAQAAQVQQEPQAAPQAKLTQLMSKNLPDFPGKEGVMITVEYPPGGSEPTHRPNAVSLHLQRFATAVRTS
jgi:flagellar basal body-associated protein FliL